MIMSVAIVDATNCAPYMAVLTVCCCLEYHRIGVLLDNGRYRSSSDGVMGMIGINIYGDSSFLSKWSWHVVWQLFNGIQVEFLPEFVILKMEWSQ
jgi:hypothetical protein